MPKTKNNLFAVSVSSGDPHRNSGLKSLGRSFAGQSNDALALPADLVAKVGTTETKNEILVLDEKQLTLHATCEMLKELKQTKILEIIMIM